MLVFEASNMQELQAEIVKYIRLLRDNRASQLTVTTSVRRKTELTIAVNILGNAAAQIESATIMKR